MALIDEIRWEVPGYVLRQLEQDSQDLKKAQALIARLRAENKALKEEKRAFFSKLDAFKVESLAKKAYQWAGAAIILKGRLREF